VKEQWVSVEEFLEFLKELQKNYSNKSLKQVMTRELFYIILRRIYFFCDNNNVVNQMKIVESPGMTEMILQWVLKTSFLNFHRNHEIILQQCLETIISLIHHNHDNQLKLASMGFMEYLQSLIDIYIKHFPSPQSINDQQQQQLKQLQFYQQQHQQQVQEQLEQLNQLQHHHQQEATEGEMDPQKLIRRFSSGTAVGGGGGGSGKIRGSFSRKSSSMIHHHRPSSASTSLPEQFSSSSSLLIHEYILQTLDHFLEQPENKIIFQNFSKYGLLLEYLQLAADYSQALEKIPKETLIALLPSTSFALTSSSATGSSSKPLISFPTPAKVVEYSLACLIRLITKDFPFCSLFFKPSSIQHLLLIQKISFQYMDTSLNITELTLSLIKEILSFRSEKFMEILYIQQFPALIMEIASHYGPYSMKIAESSIEVISFMMEISNKKLIAESIFIANSVGIFELVLVSLKKLELMNCLLSYHSVNVLFSLVKIQVDDFLMRNSNVYYALMAKGENLPLRIVQFIDEILRQHYPASNYQNKHIFKPAVNNASKQIYSSPSFTKDVNTHQQSITQQTNNNNHKNEDEDEDDHHYDLIVRSIDLLYLFCISSINVNNEPDLEIWKIIADQGFIKTLFLILDDYYSLSDSRFVIIRILECFFEVMKETKELFPMVQKSFSMSLLNNLLKYHGKNSFTLLSFVIEMMTVLYPTRSSDQLNSADEATCQLLIALLQFYEINYQQILEARYLFSLSEDNNQDDAEQQQQQPLEEKDNRSKLTVHPQSNNNETAVVIANTNSRDSFLETTASSPQNNIEDRSSKKYNPYEEETDENYLSCLLCLDGLIMVSSFPINHSIFILSNNNNDRTNTSFHLVLIAYMKKKISFSLTSANLTPSWDLSLFALQDNNNEGIEERKDAQQKILSAYPEINLRYMKYYLKSLTILKNFLSYQNNQRKFMKEGILKLIFIPLLEYYSLVNADLCILLLKCICLLATQYKLLLGQNQICEYIIYLLIFYNNIFEDQQEHNKKEPENHEVKAKKSKKQQKEQKQDTVLFNNEIASQASACIVNLVIHSPENKRRFLELKTVSLLNDAVIIQDFEIILYLQLLLKNQKIENSTKLDLKEAINVLKFDN
jgi:hypothetical protein